MGKGCCCGLFRCCLDCLCMCACQIICTVLVVAAVIVFILWFLFRPNNLKFYADQASLAEFKLRGNSTLRFNLALNVSARNPNSRLGIIYKNIEALAYYQDQRFAAKELQTFTQGTKSTRAIRAEFKGQNLVTLRDKALSRYEDEKRSREFSIDVKVQLRIKLKLWLLPLPFSLKSSFDCDLNVPLTSSGKQYQGKDCTFDWRKFYFLGH